MSTEPNALAGQDPNAGPALADDPNAAASLVADAEPTGLEPEQAEPEPGAQPEPGSSEGIEPPKEDGRVIPKWMKALQESDPEAYKRAKSDLFELRDRKAVHPTVQAAREEHELIESAGGADGLAKLREDGQFFKTAAEQFLKGDPAFVADLWEEDPIAAALHVGPMLESYKAKDIEGYKSTVARLWDNEFEAVGFDRGLQTLHQLIQAGNKDEALTWLENIASWKNKISSTARRSEDPRVKTLLAERAQRRENESKTEHESFLRDYRTETINQVVEDGAKIFDSFFKGRKIDAEDRNDLLRESFRIANLAVEKDAEFIKQRDAHLQSGDKLAAQRLTKARFARELPDAVKRVARRYGMVAGPAKPGAPASPANNGQQRTAAPSGWVAVNARPSVEEIDRELTAKANGGDYAGSIMAKKAVLKGGRKVSWAHLKT